MAKKKKVKSKVKATRYTSFKLEGAYSKKSVALWLLVDLVIGFILGLLLQPTIVAFFTSIAARNL